MWNHDYSQLKLRLEVLHYFFNHSTQVQTLDVTNIMMGLLKKLCLCIHGLLL